MLIVFIDGAVISVFIIIGLMAGAKVTDILVNIVNAHQKFLTTFMLLSTIIMCIALFSEVKGIIKKNIYIILNIFSDCIIQIGAIVLIFTELEVMASSFDNHFIGMIFMFIPGIAELFFISWIAIGGGYWLPALMNKKIAEMDEINESMIRTIAKNIVCKVVYGTIFLAFSYLLMQKHYPNSYNTIFQGTIYDFVIKIPASWMKNLSLEIYNMYRGLF